MFSTRPNPHHERPQPSKHFSASRSPASLSPPASGPDGHRRALSSTPIRLAAFVPASSLIARTTIVDHIHKPVVGHEHSGQEHGIGARYSEKTGDGLQGKPVKVHQIGTKKKVVKSAEFILDSDESDTQIDVDSYRSTELGPSTTNHAVTSAPMEQSSYFAIDQEGKGCNVKEAGTTESVQDTVSTHQDEPLLADTARQETNCNGILEESEASGIRFTALVSAYQFEGAHAEAQSDVVPPPAKRRKVAVPKVPKEPKVKKVREPKVKKVKEPKVAKVKAVKVPKPPRVKQPKKKVQTITAMATAPYLPQDLQNAQITIPEVLAAVQTAATVTIESAGPTTAKRKATTTDSDRAVKKPRKPTKSKAKTASRVEVPRILLPPSQAHRALSDQTFIFGTSSQLHVEESPTTLNQIQVAIHESELSPHSAYSQSPVKRSRARVPTAPHGTSLSLGQANRDLWCVSARDDAGGLLTSKRESQESRIGSFLEPVQDDLVEKAAEDGPKIVSVELATIQPQEDESTIGQQQDDGFVVISSDPAFDDVLDDLPLKQVLANTTSIQRHYNTSQALSPPPWPSAQRQVLQPLDANLAMKPAVETHKQVRAFAATQPSKTTVALPKRRGRPSKAAQPDALEDVVQISSSPMLPLRTIQQTTSPSKILATISSSPPSEWHNIDEISDSESPPTPSPPRKRSVASPVVENRLEFLEPHDSVAEDVPVFAPNRPSKENESQWVVILAKLYPQITATVRATPRSDSLTNPTWHEKILLYDPIVIEDLTTWLNSQGLRVTVRRSKARSRKKSTAPEPELVDEELSHWMVQKWCEEHSICCLWREGLRGGVRTKY